MTDELYCERCDQPVHVEQRKLVGLLMTCECDDETYSIKTATVLPEEWS